MIFINYFIIKYKVRPDCMSSLSELLFSVSSWEDGLSKFLSNILKTIRPITTCNYLKVSVSHHFCFVPTVLFMYVEVTEITDMERLDLLMPLLSLDK